MLFCSHRTFRPLSQPSLMLRRRLRPSISTQRRRITYRLCKEIVGFIRVLESFKPFKRQAYREKQKYYLNSLNNI